jgi:hypothetical protein
LELSVTQLQLNEPIRVETRLLQFHVFDGSCRIVVEVQSEEDAAYLCLEMGWELISACDD